MSSNRFYPSGYRGETKQCFCRELTPMEEERQRWVQIGETSAVRMGTIQASPILDGCQWVPLPQQQQPAPLRRSSRRRTPSAILAGDAAPPRARARARSTRARASVLRP